jgi:hypothetical protein
LKAWLLSGKTVELRDQGEIIARIIPEGLSPRSIDWPDFAAMRREIFGGRILPGSALAIEEGGRY